MTPTLDLKQQTNMEADPSELDLLNWLSPPPSNKELTTPFFPGRSEKVYLDQVCVMNCRKCSISLGSTGKTSSSPSHHSLPQPMCLSSLTRNGQTSSLKP